MKKVLLTGGTGFIGHSAPTLLAESGYEVHATYLNSEPISDAGVTWHRVDLLDPVQAASLIGDLGASHMLHFAWYAEPGRYWTSLENVRWLEASLGMVRAFAAAGGRRVVAAGTCAEYDWAGGAAPFSEYTSPLDPNTLYGTCKNAFRAVLESVAAELDLSVAWGRIFSVYGPAEHPERLIAHVIRALLEGNEAHCSHGEQVRDFLHTTDVASAFVQLLDSDLTGAVNIASGKPVSLRDVVSLIGEHVGRAELIRFGARESPLNDPAVITAATERLRDELGWRPRLSLDDGLASTIRWWRENPSRSA